MNMRHRFPIPMMSDTTGGGGGSSSVPGGQQPPPGDDGPRRREADLRAEAAAHRIEARTNRERAEDLQRQLDAQRAASAQAVQDALAAEKPKFEKIKLRTRDAQLAAIASSSGLLDMDLLPLIHSMPNAPKIEVNEEGEVTGVTEAVEAFKKWKPDYFKKEPAAGGGTSTVAGGQSTGSTFTPPAAGGTGTPPPKTAKEMNKDEYRQHKVDTLAAIKKGRAA